MDLKKQLIRKMIRYCLVGSFNTLVFVFISFILAMIDLNYMICTAIGYIISFFCSFYLNLRFTFQADGMLYKRLRRFILLNLTNLLIAEIIQIYLIEILAYPPNSGMLAAMAFYVIFGFFMNQIFVYNKQITLEV